MNQAVSMAAFGGNALATGHKAGHLLYSCSAIILVNPGGGSAGLFHFPAGDIYDDAQSRVLINAMIRDVRPTEAHIAFGTFNRERPFDVSDQPSDPSETNSLHHWLQGQLNFGVDLFAATGGSAMVSIQGGATQLSESSLMGVTDLEQHPAGTYQGGVRVYWK